MKPNKNAQRAIGEGRVAYFKGFEITKNPYVHYDSGLSGWWEKGWTQGQRDEQEQRCK